MTLQEDWAKRHRYPVLAAFAVLFLIGMYVSVQQAKKSAADIAAVNLKREESDRNLASALKDLGVSAKEASTATKEAATIQSLNVKLQQCLLSIQSNRRLFKPRNGECPVCGTMAEPYKQTCTVITPSPSDGSCCGIAKCSPDTPQVIRCARCSAAFWQDAEAR